ncbi:MAG: hypothetical protein ACRD2L_13455 [Terriglobia bacterium]
MPQALSPADQTILEEVVRLTIKGFDPARIAREIDLDPTTIFNFMALPAFRETFKLLEPEKFSSWEDARVAQNAEQQVRHLAQSDAVEHYTRLRELARTSSDMRDSERASLLERLVKMSGLLDREVEAEIVHLSPAQLANINQAYNEVQP